MFDISESKSLNTFVESLWIAMIFTALSLALSLSMGWISSNDINNMEVFATFTSFSCTWMCVKQTRWNYPMAILSTASLAWVFWQQNLLASAALNLYLIPTVIYGYFIWGKDATTKPVQHVELRILPQYVMFTVLAYIGAWIVARSLGGELAPLDSWLLIGSIFAQFLLDRKKIETWLVWISVNVVSIYVYFTSELYLLAIQFSLFLLNAVWGYYNWYRTMENNHA